jgi:hypothetical protein
MFPVSLNCPSWFELKRTWFDIYVFIFFIFHSILVQIKELWTYGHITQQNDTNQNIWVKLIGLWQGCRYVHDDIFYDCWSWGFRFICIVFHYYIEKYSIYKQNLCFSPCRIYFVRGSWIHACYEFMDRNTNTVKPALVTTSIKRKLVLCDHNFYFPSQCISYQLNLYEVTTCLMWPYFTVTIKQSYIICLISSIALVVHH